MHAGVMFDANTGAVVVRLVIRPTSQWAGTRGLRWRRTTGCGLALGQKLCWHAHR